MVAEWWPDEDADARVLEQCAQVLDRLHERIAHRFRRGEVRARVRRYIAGLLERVDRKNGWQLAEVIGETGPQGVQRLLTTAVWDADAVRDDLRCYVVEYRGDGPSGVLIVDETGFPKKGACSCGVAPQYCGTLGRPANCQVGVFLGDASVHGMALLDRALYLPQVWARDAARRRATGVPPEVRFATKSALAQDMLARAFAADVPAQWVVADSLYGRGQRFRRWLEQQERAYVVGILPGQVVEWQGRRQRATVVSASLPPQMWERRSAGEGSQGPRVHDGACVRLSGATPAGMARWLLIRRTLTVVPEQDFFLAYGPADTADADVVRVAGQRWAIEDGCSHAKGEVGLDEYEVRGWQAWHRQITLCLLAQAALAILCLLARQAEHAGAPRGPTAEPQVIPLTVPEVRRLTLTLAADAARRAFVLRWSHGRRAHQAVAQRCHKARHAREQATPPPVPVLLTLPRGELSTAEWERVAPLLPPQKPAVGRPRLDHRTLLSGMLWVLRTASPWREMPAQFGKWNTCAGRLVYPF